MTLVVRALGGVSYVGRNLMGLPNGIH